MRNNSTTIYKFFLMGSDLLAIVLSFTIAYVLRVSLQIGGGQVAVPIDSITYISSIAILLPFWLILMHLLGLYSKEVYDYRPKEIGRLLIAAALGIVMMIAISFFTSTPIFPSKLVAIYAFFISFLLLLVMRTLLRGVRLLLLDRHIGIQQLLILGDSPATVRLVEHIADNPRSGYVIVGVIARAGLVPKVFQVKRFDALDEAVRSTKPDVLIQTDMKQATDVYETALNHHISYRYVPTHQALESAKHSTEILGSLPMIIVHSTPLFGYGRAVKRTFDIVIGSFLIVLTSPIMLLVALAVKLSDPKGPVLMRGRMQERLTRFNRVFKVYKFRSHYTKFDGKTDEEVFTMIGKPELIKQYRKNGDKLEQDFRVTPVGRFIRRFSLDELPQLFNVLKGDISLVGPRALVPHELSAYEKKSALLSVKSGMTGLAVVSGRRSINFEERRKLDLYYVQNWSFWLDVAILLRTLTVIFRKEGS